MPFLLIDDGYTIETATKPAGRWPAINFSYRPALPARVRAYLNARAKAADDVNAELKAIGSLLMDQLVSWDVLARPDMPAPLNEGSFRRLPEPILRQLVDIVTGYGPEEQAADEKNSGTGSASC